MVGTAGSAALHFISRISARTTRTAPLPKIFSAGNASAMDTTLGSVAVGCRLPMIQNDPHQTVWSAAVPIILRRSVPSVPFLATRATIASFMEGREASGSSTWTRKEG